MKYNGLFIFQFPDEFGNLVVECLGRYMDGMFDMATDMICGGKSAYIIRLAEKYSPSSLTSTMAMFEEEVGASRFEVV